MSGAAKDFVGAIVVALISMLLVIVLMGSVVLLGQNAGRNVRGNTVEAQTPPGNAEQVSVLAYHYLRGSTGPVRLLKVLGYVVLSLPLLDDNEVWTLSVGGFEKQMRYLHNNGYRSVTLDELIAWQAGKKDLPPRSVAITFDDADRSVYEYAWPILQKYGFTATLFVVTGKVGQEWEGVSTLTWVELRELYESGVFEISSHSHNLHYRVDAERTFKPVAIAASREEFSLARYANWKAAILDDLGTSRMLIRKHVGTEARFLAWPFGESNPALDRVAREAGFTVPVRMIGGTNRQWDDPGIDRVINRFGVSARTSMQSFRKILNGTLTVDA